MKTEIKEKAVLLEKGKKTILIAGPCSAETEEQVVSTAKAIAKIEPNAIYRAGIWKPRTRPGSFEGIGLIGLSWLKKVKEETGLKVATEVATPKHVDYCMLQGIDVLWLGARTTVNPFSVQEICEALRGTSIPVLIKNAVHADLQLWIGAIERLKKSNIKNIGVIHRGFHNHQELVYRNSPRWELAIELKTLFPDIPIICDPSHITGKKQLVSGIAQQAMDIGFDGLMIETHPDPINALSDAAQQLTPAELEKLMIALVTRETSQYNMANGNQLEILRERINQTDEHLLQVLSSRMNIAKSIGDYKKENSISILQTARWEEIIGSLHQRAEHLNLNKDFVTKLYNCIHDESIKKQTQH